MRRAMMIVTVMLLASIYSLAQSPASHDQHMEHMSFTAVEQDWAKARADKSPRHQEWVNVKNGTRAVNSFLVYPEVKNKATAVIVIHEIFGMSDWVRSLTDQLAEAGYIAIAPDLVSGMGPKGGGSSEFDRSGIGQAIRDLPADQITGDLNAVADYVAKLPACNGKVAVCGFCYGGSQSFGLRLTGQASKPRSSSMVRVLITQRRSRRSSVRFMDSMAETMLASIRLYPRARS